MTNVGMLVATP